MASHKKKIIRLVLLTLILFTIFNSFQISNVKAISSYTYSFTNEDFFSINEINYTRYFNVRNSSSLTKANYSDTTYSFTNDVNGTIPNNFNDISTLTCNAEVISDYSGHDKVLKLNDTDGGQSGVRTWISNITSGTIEFWVYTTGANKHTQFLLWDLTENTGINFLIEYNSGKFGYHNGSIVDITTHIPSTWYHIKIVYDFTANWNVYINGEGFLGLDWNGAPNTLDKIDILTELGESSYYTYLDAIGYSWDPNYDIGDNLFPTETTIEAMEVDKFEFALEVFGSPYDNGDDNPSTWIDIENGYDHTNIADDILDGYDKTVKIEGIATTHEVTGLEKNDFNVLDGILNITWSLLFTELDNADCQLFFKIYSDDSTEVIRMMFRKRTATDMELYYWNGASYIELIDDMIINKHYAFNLYIDNIDICILKYSIDKVYESMFVFNPFSESLGLSKIEVYQQAQDGASGTDQITFLDYVGVYSNGTSISKVFAYANIDLGLDDTDWNTREYKDFTMNGTGNFTLNLIRAPYEPPEDFIVPLDLYNGTYNFDLYGGSFLADPYTYTPIMVVYFYNTVELNNLSVSGIKLIQGVNSYYPDFISSGINASESYFYVDSYNRLSYTLLINDTNSEYIEAIFNIPDLQTENYSLSFLSNINGNGYGFFRLNYTDDTSSFIPFPTWLTTSNVILPQTREITTFSILITDNDNYESGICNGFITNVQLIYIRDIGVSIITLNLMMVIVPIIVLLVPTFGISARYGKNTILPVFILMSVICFATGLIPVWVFFVIMLSAGAFLFMKRKAGVD